MDNDEEQMMMSLSNSKCEAFVKVGIHKDVKLEMLVTQNQNEHFAWSSIRPDMGDL
jgi:hypothetical protein